MDPKTLVLQYLDEAHATETALVTNLRAHIAMSEGQHKRLLERHLRETQEQVENIDHRRAQLGDDGDGRGLIATGVGIARDAIGQAIVLTKGPLDAVRTGNMHERMLKNARDECATEAIEIAVYDMLEAAAKAAGDSDTAKLAAEHRKTEERMLSDLRKLIPTLAVRSFEDRTGATAKSSATGSRSSSGSRTARRSSSSRSSSGSAKRSAATSSSSSSRSTSSSSTSAKRSAAGKKAAQTRKAKAAKSSSSSSSSPSKAGAKSS